MNSNKISFAIFGILVILAIALLGRAALVTMTGDSISSTETVTNGNNALGAFDGLLATTGNQWRNGDTATLTLSNSSFTGTILQVEFAIQLQTTAGAFSNDDISIQYSNDTGTTWVNAQTTIQVPTSLTTYGNYTVTASFPSIASLNNAQVRIIYTQNSGPDGPNIGIDGVEMYVTYEPPPRVSLTFPLNYTWRNTTTISFNFTPESLVNFSNCSLYINGTLNATNQSIIVNITNNTINATGFIDGDYLWNVTCIDISGFSGTSSVARIVRVDLTAPNVTLVAPPNNSIRVTFANNFVFNVTDAANISSCALVIDNVQQNSTSNPSKGVNITLASMLTNGDHRWYVNCTDENGWTRQSATWNITVSVPNITTNKAIYLRGENVNYTGFQWVSGANVTINITLPDNTYELFNVTVNSTGGINASRLIGLSYPLGTYNILAIQTNDSARNATTSFIVISTPYIINSVVGPDPVVLNAGATKFISCNSTAIDNSTPITANATLYLNNTPLSSLIDNRTRYSNSSCAITGSTGTITNISCGFAVLYYAVNGSWWCNITANDTYTVFNNVSKFNIDPLYALNVSLTLLDFGTLENDEISANISENTTNIGNQPINVSVYGYGRTRGDNNSFTCPTENISINLMKYSMNSSHSYLEKTNLSGTLTTTNLFIRSQENATATLNTTYWQFQVPWNFTDRGLCNGTIVFQAELS